MTLAIDHAWGVPDPQAIKQAGYALVLRYISNTPDKDLSAAERDGLLATGLDIGLVFETTANRALGGAAAGAADGAQMRSRMNALAAPHRMGAFFAVDFDVAASDLPVIGAYFDAARGGLGGDYRTGGYGEFSVIKYLLDGGHIDLGWQTRAWSGTPVQIDPRAALYQNAQSVTINGVQCDVNVIEHADYGGWLGADVALTPDDIDAVANAVVKKLAPAFALVHTDAATIIHGDKTHPNNEDSISAKCDQILAAISSASPTPSSGPALSAHDVAVETLHLLGQASSQVQ